MSGIAGSYGKSIISFIRVSILLCIVVTLIYISTSSGWEFPFPHILANIYNCVLLSLPFLHCVFWDLLWKIRWLYLHRFLWVLYSIPFVFLSAFCVNIMKFLLLWLCSIVWSQVLWYLPCCYFGSGLLWLCKVFCNTTKNISKDVGEKESHLCIKII
jgi:hypothetical protein